MLRDRAETELGNWVRPLHLRVSLLMEACSLAPTLREKVTLPVSAPPLSPPPSQSPADMALSSMTDTQTKPSDGGIQSVTRLGPATPPIEQTRCSQRAVNWTAE